MISTILTCAAVVAFAPHCLAQPHSGTVGSNAHSSADVRRDEDFTYPQARIMNGDSQVEVIPYMAALRNVQRFNNGRIQIKTYCGASLIHKDWILTAGHCVETDGVSNTHGNEAWIGCLDLTESDTCVVREIVEYKCHEEFMFDTIEGVHNDICVMKLNESVTDLEVATMNDLPANEVAGTNTTVVGFGTLSENLGASSQLQTVDLPLQPTAVCENTFNYNNKVFFLPDEMMCAGYRTGFFDACLGDSGGPQFVQNWTQPQIGIVSWGDGCGRPDKYGVYTRVSHYIDWIQATTGTPIQLASLDGGLSYEEDLPATTPKDTSATESSTPVPSASSEALVTTSPLHSASPSAVATPATLTLTANGTSNAQGVLEVQTPQEFPAWCTESTCIAVESALPADYPAGTLQFRSFNVTAGDTSIIGYKGPADTALTVTTGSNGGGELLVTLGPVVNDTYTYEYASCNNSTQEIYVNFLIPENTVGGRVNIWFVESEGCIAR